MQELQVGVQLCCNCCKSLFSGAFLKGHHILYLKTISQHLYQFPRVTVTNYHKWGGLKQWKCVLSQPWFKIKCQQSVPSRASGVSRFASPLLLVVTFKP